MSSIGTPCGPLTLDDDGTVWLEATTEDERAVKLGHIDDGCPDPDLAEPWEWLLAEWRDAVRGTAGYRAEIDRTWFGRHGNVARW